jgi:tRNA (uracil-5-)-methyltransferase TRM9
MKPATIQQLVDLNRQFYQTFAVQFSRTRQRLQPGVQRILHSLPLQANVLDLGCGNGELARALVLRGQVGAYTGLDFAPEMLVDARKRLAELAQGSAPNSLAYEFLEADLAVPGWASLLPGSPQVYDWILACAVLHHLPGMELRSEVVRSAGSCLAPGGRFTHSNWQFLNSPRLRGRIQPWETVGLLPDDVDLGDYLLDWREGGAGLRYAHHFSEGELQALAQENGFVIEESFLSDGEQGNLGLYQVWKQV